MAKDPRLTQETFQCMLDPTTFKALLRDLLFREAGKPYFKGLYVPRPRRFFGSAWRAMSRYAAEQQMLPVGRKDTDGLIQQFFVTHKQLRVLFRSWGMPVRVVQVLRQQSAVHNAAVEQVQSLECSWESQHNAYVVLVTGGPVPPQASYDEKLPEDEPGMYRFE
jgi:hypothetical protein